MGRRKKKDASVSNHVIVVQDRSGSMGSRVEETISGFNQFIQELKEKGAGSTFVTLVQFDTRVAVLYSEKPLAEVPELNSTTYSVQGMTALNDAVAQAITRTEGKVKEGDNVAVTIMTDGGENSSQEYPSTPEGLERIRALIGRKEADGWEFNYLGAGPASWAGAQSLGIASSHTINYGNAAEDHQVAFRAAAMSNVAKTRGLTSSYAASTPLLKADLESKAGYVDPSNLTVDPGLTVVPTPRGSGRRVRTKS